MKRLLAIIYLSMMLMTTGCEGDQTKGEIKLVTAEEMHTLIDQKEVQLVDVRTPEEREDGFIANSQNIDFNSPTFDDDIEKLDKMKPVILYCEAGGRSAQCAEKLLAAGFIKIYDLKGGITQWEFNGFDLETN